MINFFFENIESPEFPPNTQEWLENIINSEDKKPGEISYIFSDDEYILKINRDYLDHDYYTDIITFDYVKGKTISGDIFVSLQRVFDNAKNLYKKHDEELLRVLAHGILHLCGYGDKSADEKKLMRSKEDFYLKLYQNFL